MSGQKKRKWFSLFKKLVSEPDTEWEFIDGSYLKAHQHSAGASGADSQAIGKSRAGNTKIFIWQSIVMIYPLSLQ